LAPRRGDEIVAAGQMFHTGTPVVLWLDPGGYDAYRVERRFSPFEQSSWEVSRAASRAPTSPNRYGLRREPLTPEQLEQVRGGGWDLSLLKKVVDQFVIHYDACGTSRRCFEVLHDLRTLSVHFLLDLDGTIYQTLDLKERAWHATSSNTRSIGIEIAHIGAYPSARTNVLAEWYQAGADGHPRITLPLRLGRGGVRTPGFVGRPARPELVRGVVQETELAQFDFTPEQYQALAKLTATLCRVFPKLKCDYPHEASGGLASRKLPDGELSRYQGLLGHFHIQTNKVDPGPAFQWDRLVTEARRLMRAPAASSPKAWAQRHLGQ
jgi:N-acetyl-anhydromuramyl-L-alanine amidase AmpD